MKRGPRPGTGGRPPLDPASRRTVRVSVSFTPWEAKALTLFLCDEGEKLGDGLYGLAQKFLRELGVREPPTKLEAE